MILDVFKRGDTFAADRLWLDAYAPVALVLTAWTSTCVLLAAPRRPQKMIDEIETAAQLACRHHHALGPTSFERVFCIETAAGDPEGIQIAEWLQDQKRWRSGGVDDDGGFIDQAIKVLRMHYPGEFTWRDDHV